uniref:Uncharacterized protein n=1 Tax=Oryza punctata TaxID=4537 RepID=A0A0E0JJI7_ORYPU
MPTTDERMLDQWLRALLVFPLKEKSSTTLRTSTSKRSPTSTRAEIQAETPRTLHREDPIGKPHRPGMIVPKLRRYRPNKKIEAQIYKRDVMKLPKLPWDVTGQLIARERKIKPEAQGVQPSHKIGTREGDPRDDICRGSSMSLAPQVMPVQLHGWISYLHVPSWCSEKPFKVDFQWRRAATSARSDSAAGLAPWASVRAKRSSRSISFRCFNTPSRGRKAVPTPVHGGGGGACAWKKEAVVTRLRLLRSGPPGVSCGGADAGVREWQRKRMEGGSGDRRAEGKGGSADARREEEAPPVHRTRREVATARLWPLRSGPLGASGGGGDGGEEAASQVRIGVVASTHFQPLDTKSINVAQPVCNTLYCTKVTR